MPRFFDPERYNEDWYIEMKGEYQKFFDYVIETCDNAGVWKPNKFDFETKTGFKVNLDSLLQKANRGKERLIVLENGRWLVPGFVNFQWFNKKTSFVLFSGHPFHKNIIKSLDANKCQGLVKGLERVCQGVKDKDKDVLGSSERGIVKGENVLYSIEHCAVIALNDPRFVKANKVTEKEMMEFNAILEKQGVYQKNPGEYKSHYANWRGKYQVKTGLKKGMVE